VLNKYDCVKLSLVELPLPGFPAPTRDGQTKVGRSYMYMLRAPRDEKVADDTVSEMT
jgi:hypothetical protein